MIRLNKWLFYSDLLGEIKSGIVSFCGFERCLKFFLKFLKILKTLEIFTSFSQCFNEFKFV